MTFVVENQIYVDLFRSRNAKELISYMEDGALFFFTKIEFYGKKVSPLTMAIIFDVELFFEYLINPDGPHSFTSPTEVEIVKEEIKALKQENFTEKYLNRLDGLLRFDQNLFRTEQKTFLPHASSLRSGGYPLYCSFNFPCNIPSILKCGP